MTTERKPMRLRPRLLALAAVVALAACTPSPSASPAPSEAASAEPSGAPTGELREVRLLLGFRPDVQFAPFYVAQQEGYFADHGLEVTIEHADGGELVRLVADGQADFGVADATDVMIARTSGIPVTYVSTLFQSFPVAVIGALGTVPAEPSRLAGASIGTPGRFGSSWHALLALLDAGGLTEADVTIREYPQFNQTEGLLAGDVGLITGFRNNEPLRLEAEGMETELLTVDEVAPLPGPGMVVGDELLTADRDVVTAFVQAVAEAQEAVIEDPELGLEAAITEIPTLAEDEDTARAVLLATVDLWADESGPGVGVIDPAVWEAGYGTMTGLGFIDGSVPVEDMYEEILPAG
jgi:NitT/TauT family transport system substrate-binding protein